MHHIIANIEPMALPLANPWITLDEWDDRVAAEDSECRRLWYATALASTVGVAIAKYRYEHKLSLTALGKMIGMRQRQVTRLEDGEHNPTIETLTRVCDALGLEITITIGPKLATRRVVPKALQRGVCDATDQIVIGVRER